MSTDDRRGIPWEVLALGAGILALFAPWWLIRSPSPPPPAAPSPVPAAPDVEPAPAPEVEPAPAPEVEPAPATPPAPIRLVREGPAADAEAVDTEDLDEPYVALQSVAISLSFSAVSDLCLLDWARDQGLRELAFEYETAIDSRGLAAVTMLDAHDLPEDAVACVHDVMWAMPTAPLPIDGVWVQTHSFELVDNRESGSRNTSPLEDRVRKAQNILEAQERVGL